MAAQILEFKRSAVVASEVIDAAGEGTLLVVIRPIDLPVNAKYNYQEIKVVIIGHGESEITAPDGETL